MATSGVDLGVLTGSAGGSFRLSGTSSGLDTAELVDAMVAARRVAATRLETRIEANDARAAALGELEGHLSGLRSAVAGLRSPPGFLGAADNVFEGKDVFLTADTATSPASLLGVQAANTAAAGQFEIVVDQLATARKLSGDPVADASAPLADSLNGGSPFEGSFTIGLAGSGRTAEIAVTGEMSLNDLRAAINGVQADAGVTATTLGVGPSDHRLVLTAREPGTEVVLAPAGGADVLGILGLSADGGTSFAHGLAEPREARFSIDGVPLGRTSNTVTDAVPGLTLSLFRAEPGTTVTVEVTPSLVSIKERIAGFVEAYNGLRDFAAGQTALDSAGKAAEGSVLFGDSNLRSVMQAAGGIVGGEVTGIEPDLARSLAGIGIRLDEANRLELDETALDQALLTRLDEVRGVFEFRFEASSPELGLFSRGESLTATRFTVEIVDSDGDGVPESATADGVALEVTGQRLSGRAGTAWEGLTMLWSGTGDSSVDVRTSSGVAERLFNLVETTIDPDNGRLSQAIDSVTSQNARYAGEVARIEERVADYREGLIRRFAAMEQAMSLANSMITQIRAQVGATGSEK